MNLPAKYLSKYSSGDLRFDMYDLISRPTLVKDPIFNPGLAEPSSPAALVSITYIYLFSALVYDTTSRSHPSPNEPTNESSVISIQNSS